MAEKVIAQVNLEIAQIDELFKSYSFQLEWEELAKLILPMEDLWQKIKNELQTFLDSLRLKNEENQIYIEHE